MPDDHDDGVTVVLESAQRIEDDQVADVQVRGSRIEPELDTQLVPSVEAGAQMVGDHDLHRPLPQAIKELPAHRSLRIDGVGAEELLRITRKQRLKQGDDRPVGRIDQVDHEK